MSINAIIEIIKNGLKSAVIYAVAYIFTAVLTTLLLPADTTFADDKEE